MNKAVVTKKSIKGVKILSQKEIDELLSKIASKDSE